MNPFVGVGLVLALAACGVAQAPVLSQVPQEDQIIQMSYVALSDCVYSYIDPLYDNAVKKIDRKPGITPLGNHFHRFRKFKVQGHFTVTNTLWGPNSRSQDQIRQGIKKCSASG